MIYLIYLPELPTLSQTRNLAWASIRGSVLLLQLYLYSLHAVCVCAFPPIQHFVRVVNTPALPSGTLESFLAARVVCEYSMLVLIYRCRVYARTRVLRVATRSLLPRAVCFLFVADRLRRSGEPKKITSRPIHLPGRADTLVYVSDLYYLQ